MRWFWSLMPLSLLLLWTAPLAPVTPAAEDDPRASPEIDDLSVW